MVVRESPTVEYKESVTPTFLKTVSAYANYGTGKIEFGVDDEGVVVGLADPVAECLRIENMINDSLDPAPRYTLEPDGQASGPAVPRDAHHDGVVPSVRRCRVVASALVHDGLFHHDDGNLLGAY